MSQKNNQPEWKRAKINWVNATYMTLTPILAMAAAIAIALTQGVSWFAPVIFVVMYLIGGLSITAGYHRLFAHRSYHASKLVRWLTLFFGAGAYQNSAYKWSSDHRYHHKYVDTDNDPYNVKRGFFWAHIGWIYYGDPEGRSYNNVPDLRAQKDVMFQRDHYMLVAFASGYLFPTLVGALFGKAIEGFVWGGLVRLVILHHSTFLINSAAHYFGKTPYSVENSAKDNWWLGIFTFGEGYHNFHHAFEADYRNGVRWYQFDLTKWLIFFLSLVGSAKKLNRVPDWQLLKRKLDVQKITALKFIPALTPIDHNNLITARDVAEDALNELRQMSHDLSQKKTREWKLYRANAVRALEEYRQLVKVYTREYSVQFAS